MFIPIKRSYGVIGAGAVGLYYGAQLQDAGHSVHYLSRSGYEAMHQQGLILETHDKKIIQTPIHVYPTAHTMPACDVLLICLKTTQNARLATTLPHLLKPKTILIPLQNGLGNEAFLASLAPQNQIIAATATIGAQKSAPGHVYYSYPGTLQLAEFQSPTTQSIQVIDLLSDFENAEIRTQHEDDYLLMRWKKLLWNICFNGLSVVYQMSGKELIAHHRPELEALAKEALTIAAAYGREIHWTYFEFLMKSTANMPGNHKSSMLQDSEKNQPLEIEYIYGNPLKAAQARGIHCPQLEKLYAELLISNSMIYCKMK